MRKFRIDWVKDRAELPARRDPYWQRVGEGRFIGYRKMSEGKPGAWLARIEGGARYIQKPLGDFLDVKEAERYGAALTAANEWFSHIEGGGSKDSGTVADACRAYIERLKSEKRDHADSEGRFIRLVCGGTRKIGDGSKTKAYDADPIARIELAKLKRSDVEAWRDRVRKASNTASTYERNITPFRAALNLAKDQRNVSDLAWAVALKPLGGTKPRRELYLDADQRRALIEHAREPVRPFLEILRMVPLRPGEAANLRVEDFDSKRATLLVRSAMRGNKTGKRYIPLGANAVAHLKECARRKLPAAWLFTQANGEQWKKEAWRDEVRDAQKAARLPAATVAYTLRHGVITDLVLGGLDIFTVAKIAGTSVKMIEDHYGHLNKENARVALDGIAL